jgi:hypothetical protein
MPATFQWAQFTGSTGAASTPYSHYTIGTSSGAGMSWDFETADSTGTQSYTANPVSAGSNSWPVWLKGYWTSGAGFTISNIKFWNWQPGSSAAPTASFTVYGTTNTQYSVATGTATAAAFAGNVAVPTSANSTTAPGSPLSYSASFGTSAGNSMLQSPGYFCLQLAANAAAPAGTSGYFGFTLQYDEV